MLGASSIPAASTREIPANSGDSHGSSVNSAPAIAPALAKIERRPDPSAGDEGSAPAWLLTIGLAILLAIAIAAIGGPEPSAATPRAEAAIAARPMLRGRAAIRTTPAATIRRIFGKRYGVAAVKVARCESSLDPAARNGQYRGLFQMGSAERAAYGHGSTARAQARAARRYFNATGRDWSPWSCKP